MVRVRTEMQYTPGGLTPGAMEVEHLYTKAFSNLNYRNMMCVLQNVHVQKEGVCAQ